MENNVRMRMVKTMYDDLIGELRTRAEFLNSARGENEDSVRMVRAADAIEELQGQIDGRIEQERKALLKSVPKWISVKERLPEHRGHYFVCYAYEGTSWIQTDFWNDVRFIADNKRATHWMPLPEMPEMPKESEE